MCVVRMETRTEHIGHTARCTIHNGHPVHGRRTTHIRVRCWMFAGTAYANTHHVRLTRTRQIAVQRERARRTYFVLSLSSLPFFFTSSLSLSFSLLLLLSLFSFSFCHSCFFCLFLSIFLFRLSLSVFSFRSLSLSLPLSAKMTDHKSNCASGHDTL